MYEKLIELSKSEEERAAELHNKSIIVDASGGDIGAMGWTPRMLQKMNEMLDSGTNKDSHDIRNAVAKVKVEEIISNKKTYKEYVENWRMSGVTCVSSTVGSSHKSYIGDLPRIMRRIPLFAYKFDRLGDVLVKATCAEDVRRAKREDKHAVLYNFQNTLMIGYDTDQLDFWYSMGVRMIQLTYNLRNFIGDGCTERYESGLSHFGVEVVERMNKLGMIVDIAHSGYQTTLDAIEVSKDPIAASHTSCRGVYDHDRGKTDEEIKALAEKGGVMGILLVPPFISAKDPWEVTIDDVLDQISYAVDLVGADYVGIGTDRGGKGIPDVRTRKRYSELTRTDLLSQDARAGFRPEHRITLRPPEEKKEIRTPIGWEDPTKWPNFTRGLVSRGYSDQEIQKILGGNWLRLIERVVG